MADFYSARISIHYTPKAEGATGWTLTTPGQYLPGEPAREWNTETSTHNLVGSPYGLDVPAGNARLVFDWEVLVQRSTVAKLERYLRRLEIALNTARAGKLDMAEAYHAGAPTLLTRWDAVVNSCTVRRCTSEEAPAEPGAWGAVVLSFTLTNPEEI